MKVLFISTSHDQLGDTSNRTGVWLEEIAAPYFYFRDAGADITLASPKGGAVPVDPKSQSIIVATRATKNFLADEEARNFLANSELLEQIKAEEFDLVFLPGGHGAMWDLANNKLVKEILETFNRKNKPIGAVCHGIAGLLAVQNESGELLIKGKRITCCSNLEENSRGLNNVVPFLLESQVQGIGAVYSCGPAYVSHTVVDGNIVTGQNPASSEEVAKKLFTMGHHPVKIAQPGFYTPSLISQ